MRFLIMLIMILILFCSFISAEVFEEPLLGYDLFYDDSFNEIESYVEIPLWIMTNFLPIADNNWNSPEEIMKNKYINSNNFTILTINILKVRFNIETNLVIIDTHDIEWFGSIGNKNQAHIEFLNIIYVVYNLEYEICSRQPNYIYLFNKVFNTTHLNPKMIL